MFEAKLEPNEKNVLVAMKKEQTSKEYMAACTKIMKDFVRDEWDEGQDNKYKQYFVIAFLNINLYLQDTENFYAMEDVGEIPWDLNNDKTDKAKRLIKKRWDLSNLTEDAYLMTSMLDYWRIHLFENKLIRVGFNNQTGLGIYLRNYYTTFERVRDECIGFLIPLSTESPHFKELRSWKCPSLYINNDKCGFLFGTMAFINHNSEAEYLCCKENERLMHKVNIKVTLWAQEDKDYGYFRYNANEVTIERTKNRLNKLKLSKFEQGRMDMREHLTTFQYGFGFDIVMLSSTHPLKLPIDIDSYDYQINAKYYSCNNFFNNLYVNDQSTPIDVSYIPTAEGTDLRRTDETPSTGKRIKMEK